MTQVLLVDHPLFAAELQPLLEATPGFRVRHCVPDTERVLQAVQTHRPEVLALGLHGARQTTLEIVTQVMRVCPTPIVMVADADGSEAQVCFQAMEAGALAVAEWPGPASPGGRALAQNALVTTLATMAEVRVVRRWGRSRPVESSRPTSRARLAVIGGSTGGPAVLRDILAELPKDFPLPVVVVQHMAAGFLQAFAQWLETASGFPVSVATDGAPLRPGRAWLAPDGLQLGVTRELTATLTAAEPEHGMCPSVSWLFRSVPVELRAATAAVLLTGMGRDGASELKQLKDNGALTLVQDRATSVVYGMPGEALRQDAAMLILSPRDIGRALANFANASGPPIPPHPARGEHG